MKLSSALALTLAISSALASSLACTSEKKFASSTQVGGAFKQVNEKNINFGDSDVFRIGDGTAGVQSSCASELKGYDLKGSTYYFQFEVLEDDTGIDINVGKICGVDRDNMTTIALVSTSGSSSSSQPETPVPTDKSGRSSVFVPYRQFKLQKGIYSLVVASKNTTGSTAPATPGVDVFDDFIIGNIEVKGQKKVKAVKVYAE